jgi:hypothetical protein
MMVILMASAMGAVSIFVIMMTVFGRRGET